MVLHKTKFPSNIPAQGLQGDWQVPLRFSKCKTNCQGVKKPNVNEINGSQGSPL